MAAFTSKIESLSASTATRIVESADFDRQVVLNGSGSVRIAFTSADASGGVAVTDLVMAASVDTAQIVLPADEELWAWSSASDSVSVFVTSIAR